MNIMLGQCPIKSFMDGIGHFKSVQINERNLIDLDLFMGMYFEELDNSPRETLTQK